MSHVLSRRYELDNYLTYQQMFLHVFKQWILQCIEAISNDLLQRAMASIPARMQEHSGGDRLDLKNVTFWLWRLQFILHLAVNIPTV